MYQIVTARVTESYSYSCSYNVTERSFRAHWIPQCGPGNKAADGALYASHTPCPSRLQHPWTSHPTSIPYEISVKTRGPSPQIKPSFLKARETGGFTLHHLNVFVTNEQEDACLTFGLMNTESNLELNQASGLWHALLTHDKQSSQ